MGTTCLSLLRRIGDGAASTTWSEFLSTYLPFIDSQLRRLGLHEFDAMDIRQNVLCILLRELPSFEHSGNTGAFRCWLRTVTTNQIRSHFRQSRRLPIASELNEDSLASENNEFNQWWEQEYASYVFQQAMTRLSGRFDDTTLESFKRQFLEDDPPSEVAAATRSSKQAVIAAKCRVLRALREELRALKADV